MTRRIGIPVVATVAASLLLVASGCGGSKKSSSATTSSAVTTTAVTTAPATTSASSGTVPLSQWTNGFCSAVGNWATAVRSAGQALQGNPSKANLQALVATLKNANQTLVASLKSLGAPDTPGGEQTKAAVDSLATALKSHADAINSAIAGTAGAQGVKATVAALSTNLIAMGQAFKSTLSQLKTLNASAKDSFKQAFKESSACQKLKAQGA
jgi:hypothetical protein